MRYKSPTGNIIIGVQETVQLTSMVNGLEVDGLPIYAGESDVDWNTQEMIRDPFRYTDSTGRLWRFEDLTPEPEAKD